MIKKDQGRKWWHGRALVLALEVALIGCFFIGIFNNSQITRRGFSEDAWYYVNRGYPAAWAGVSKVELPVPFPLVKAPFLRREISEGQVYQKIIDLQVFVPLLLAVWLLIYAGLLVGGHLTGANKSFTFGMICLLPILLFFYFLWFDRV